MQHEDRQSSNAGDARSRDQRAADAGAVRRQHAALLNGRGSRGFQERITHLILARRREAGDTVEQFDIAKAGARDGTPVVRGVLLVRPELEQRAPELFAQLVAQVGPPQPRLEGRLLQLRGNKLPADALVDLARTVRHQGFEASVDHIVPLGIVCKGEGGPARTLLANPLAAPRQRDGATRVAVIDTGVATKGHEHDWQSPLSTADNIDALDAFPAPGGDGLLDAAAGHGAFATGVVQQVDPHGVIRVHRAMDSDGIGSEVTVAETLLRAVREQGAEIVNLSLGAQTVDDQPLLALQVAFEMLSESGHDDVLLVAAAGNFGDTRPCWPAAFRRVVAVAGLTAELKPAAWSSHGHWVDVSTVAEGVVSTYVRGKESPQLSPASAGPPDDWPMADSSPWAVWTGTSFAAPQVAAEVARRLTEARAGGDTSATPRTVLRALLAEGHRLPDYGVALRILGGTPITP
ncbi:MAG: hypothetical protein QOH99_18 [Frankiaceae bacterium]|jgi:hypothetical protein|nr:hypothetical protein [Frankiaceae bacterium]